MNDILSQGAESIIILKKDRIKKDRIKKSYRLDILDNKIRKQRTKKESKLLIKASKIIPAPKIFSVSDFILELEYIPGKKLSENLDNLSKPQKICELIGQNISILHDNDIIHGDLTTSNMIYYNKKVYFIDFGLGFESKKIEDKASDLRLIKQALQARHFDHYELLFKNILKGYSRSKNYEIVLSRLKKVESRGRYKEKF